MLWLLISRKNVTDSSIDMFEVVLHEKYHYHAPRKHRIFPPQHPKNTRISLICQVLYQLVVDQQASLIQRVLKTFSHEQIR